MPVTVASESAVAYRCGACPGEAWLPLTEPSQALVCSDCGKRARGENGILVINGQEDIAADYPDSVYALLASVEPRHFWFVERNRLILSTMREALGPLSGRRALDVGCGTGYVMSALEQAGMLVCGLDMHMAGLIHARARTRGPLLCEQATRIPFTGAFDAAMLCDVIEHTPDDVEVLRAARASVVPHGAVVVTVPAHQALWSVMDDVSGHKRRYSRSSLERVMRMAGIDVHLVRYYNALLWPAQFAHRRLLGSGARRATSDSTLEVLTRGLLPPPEPLNALMRLAMRFDLVLSRSPWSFGTSLIAVGTSR